MGFVQGMRQHPLDDMQYQHRVNNLQQQQQQQQQGVAWGRARATYIPVAAATPAHKREMKAIKQRVKHLVNREKQVREKRQRQEKAKALALLYPKAERKRDKGTLTSFLQQAGGTVHGRPKAEFVGYLLGLYAKRDHKRLKHAVADAWKETGGDANTLRFLENKLSAWDMMERLKGTHAS
jgi:hypothetical protein